MELHKDTNTLLGMAPLSFDNTQYTICEMRDFLAGTRLRKGQGTDSFLARMRSAHRSWYHDVLLLFVWGMVAVRDTQRKS